MLHEPEAGDRGRLIELFASPEVGTFLGGHRSRDELEQAMPAAPSRRPVVLCTQSANARSVRLAERLGFVELERFEEYGAEQWFGVRYSTDA